MWTVIQHTTGYRRMVMYSGDERRAELIAGSTEAHVEAEPINPYPRRRDLSARQCHPADADARRELVSHLRDIEDAVRRDEVPPLLQMTGPPHFEGQLRE